MYKSPSHLPEQARAKIADALNARLADGLDLHSQIKVAHWNIKGPQFAALHPLFETFAVSLAAHNDAIAERAVTLGARAFGTARHVAKVSTLPEYPRDAVRDMEHVGLLAERIEQYLDGTRAGARERRQAGRHRHGRPADRDHHRVREARLVPARLSGTVAVDYNAAMSVSDGGVWMLCSACRKAIAFRQIALGVQRVDLQPQPHAPGVLLGGVLGLAPLDDSPPRGVGGRGDGSQPRRARPRRGGCRPSSALRRHR